MPRSFLTPDYPYCLTYTPPGQCEIRGGSAIDALLDPVSHIGLSASIVHRQVEVARQLASGIHARLQQ
ncbi:MAG: hypothetical protein JO271_00145 [Verrucomicrobia bacterium]|nr:hypothetical protein [Verrucomicrobiota bacterium]